MKVPEPWLTLKALALTWVRLSALVKVARATCAILRVTPLSKMAVTKPFSSISMLERLPKAVPLVTTACTTESESYWVRPPAEAFRLKLRDWVSMPRPSAHLISPAAGAAAFDAPKLRMPQT